MIQLSQFDYDVTSIDIIATDSKTKKKSDCKIVIISSFCEEAIKASSLYGQSVKAAEDAGIKLIEEYENLGIPMQQFTDTYKKLRAQFAASLVVEWPIDEDIFETLVDSQSACNAIIKASEDRGTEFLKKKKD